MRFVTNGLIGNGRHILLLFGHIVFGNAWLYTWDFGDN
jgi:hypothetical protein